MNIIKYLLSKSYRRKFKSEYTKEICDRFSLEQNRMEAIYGAILDKK
jgi:hypothetical protein